MDSEVDAVVKNVHFRQRRIEYAQALHTSLHAQGCSFDRRGVTLETQNMARARIGKLSVDQKKGGKQLRHGTRCVCCKFRARRQISLGVREINTQFTNALRKYRSSLRFSRILNCSRSTLTSNLQERLYHRMIPLRDLKTQADLIDGPPVRPIRTETLRQSRD